ncbi:MAG: hypothetical protein MZV70_67615 [Desulfobacterales bacterium]|nr:hypothetical protein [Desulfobacterales bacterium]
MRIVLVHPAGSNWIPGRKGHHRHGQPDGPPGAALHRGLSGAGGPRGLCPRLPGPAGGCRGRRERPPHPRA